MPLFHFHLDGQFSSQDDDDATELANLTDAISFAEELAAELRRNHAPEELIGRNILIFDNAGQASAGDPGSVMSSSPLHRSADLTR